MDSFFCLFEISDFIDVRTKSDLIVKSLFTQAVEVCLQQ